MPFLLPWLPEMPANEANRSPGDLIDLDPEVEATSGSDGVEAAWYLDLATRDAEGGEESAPADAWDVSAGDWGTGGLEEELELLPPPVLPPLAAERAATWEFDEELLPLGESLPEDEGPILTETPLPGPRAAADPSDPSLEAGVADRLERIARSLRERGLGAAIQEHAADPLGAIVGAYLSGYLESRRSHDLSPPG
jgi:hypothetical protein